jgi:glutathione synthase/RimK-type ligase-like ATP-grasp enzyme
MAIFSQNDTQTQTDFRHYNSQKPNRTVPYKLPKLIKEKITLLMNKLNLICGSLDLINTNEGGYVFLEVNPNGQFGMISKPCNYQLEKKIATFLINTHERSIY